MMGLKFFSFKILSFSFFSCFLAYNFINNLIENDNQGFISMNKFSLNKLLFILLLFILIYLLFNLKLISAISFIVLAPFIFFYSYLRKIKYFKIFMIAFSWSYFSVLLPAVELLVAIDEKIILIFLAIYLKVLAITIPFDIRDIEFDKSKLVTIPIKLGIQKSKILSIILSSISTLITFIIWHFNYVDLEFFLTFLITTILLSVFLFLKSNQFTSQKCSFLFEGIFILMPTILFILNGFEI